MGYAWYMREFEVPEDFDRTNLQLLAGMVDEADEVYVNGFAYLLSGLEPVEGDTALTESESDLLASDMTAETEPKE